MYKKFKLDISPKCFKCKGSTVHYRMSENTFLNTMFITEWFICKKCGRIQAKIVKIVRKLHGWKIPNLA